MAEHSKCVEMIASLTWHYRDSSSYCTDRLSCRCCLLANHVKALWCSDLQL